MGFSSLTSNVQLAIIGAVFIIAIAGILIVRKMIVKYEKVKITKEGIELEDKAQKKEGEDGNTEKPIKAG